jgi:hypothetical protein
MPLFPEPSSANPESAVHYRALSPLAVVSVVVGALSIPVLVFWFSWFWAVAPLLGITLGWRAMRQIDDAPGEYTGRVLARAGIWFSCVLWVFGYAWLIFAGAREIPYGYALVRYEDLQPDPNTPAEPIPQSALDLKEKRIFIKGFMQPRRQQAGIKDFILCPSTGDCQFCTVNPKMTEKIRVVLQGDLEATYTTRQIGVGGRFQVDPQDSGGIPYSIEADCLR